jgi:hypothetical protein
MGPDEEGIVTEADVRSADVTLDAILPLTPRSMMPAEWAAFRQRLRGLLAGQMALVRTAGYIEGEQAGRRQAGRIVRDALDGEGL